jgi:hypothetical protein
MAQATGFVPNVADPVALETVSHIKPVAPMHSNTDRCGDWRLKSRGSKQPPGPSMSDGQFGWDTCLFDSSAQDGIQRISAFVPAISVDALNRI